MRIRLVVLATAATVCCLWGSIPIANADSAPLLALGNAAQSGKAQTVPYFSDSFSFDGTSYPYYMVGTDPETSRAITIVPTVIVPLRLSFADGYVADPGDAVARVLASPLFVPTRFASGYTQYGDAVRRAMFWSYDAHDGYHVLLAPPLVLPTVTLRVPAADGVVVPAGGAAGPPALGLHDEAETGVVSASWFHSVFPSLVGAHPDPHVLPIVLSRNVALSTDPIPDGYPTVGFHTAFLLPSAGTQERIETAIWASYEDPYAVIELPQILQNIDDLSHEVAEWMHDPFLNNVVPSWESPLPLANYFYGCSDLLETSDPLADVGVEVNGYQLPDAAFLSWFAHQVPSIGINGHYSFFGAFTEPAPLC